MQMGVFGYFGGTENGTSGARIKILKPLFNTNTPPKICIFRPQGVLKSKKFQKKPTLKFNFTLKNM